MMNNENHGSWGERWRHWGFDPAGGFRVVVLTWALAMLVMVAAQVGPVFTGDQTWREAVVPILIALGITFPFVGLIVVQERRRRQRRDGKK